MTGTDEAYKLALFITTSKTTYYETFELRQWDAVPILHVKGIADEDVDAFAESVYKANPKGAPMPLIVVGHEIDLEVYMLGPAPRKEIEGQMELEYGS